MAIIPQEVGKRIRFLRQGRGLKQHELAEALNISMAYICKLEHGNNIPSVDLCLELSDCLGVSVDYLLTGKPQYGDATKDLIHKTIHALILLEQQI